MIPVCIFAKPFISGHVKTRLARALGAKRAADLAAAMFKDVWGTVSSCPGVRPVLATLDAEVEWAEDARSECPIQILPGDILLQGDGDLGARLETVFCKALATAPAAIAVGADTPLLTSQHLREALDGLATHDAVIGPCPDGGFYLLALRACPRGLFSELPWSTPETAFATKRRLEARGLSVQQIEPLFDVDTPDDLALLAASLTHQPSIAPATYAWRLENDI
ncbi:MAG: TIGR04282 family arsenosugar biosynthesis glycosyltransferase [Bryobacteraceae bacterium]